MYNYVFKEKCWKKNFNRTLAWS